MRTSVVKAKLARDEPVLVVCLHLTDPSVYEMTSLLGFDCIWMDLEHHGYSVETASNLMRAARVGAGTDIVGRPRRPPRSSSGASSPPRAAAAPTGPTPTCPT